MYLILFKQIHPIYRFNYDDVNLQLFAKVQWHFLEHEVIIALNVISSIIIGYKSKIVDDVDIYLNNAYGVMHVAIDKNSCKVEVSRSL